MTKSELLDIVAELYDTVLGINLRLKGLLEEIEGIEGKLQSIPEKPSEIIEDEP